VWKLPQKSTQTWMRGQQWLVLQVLIRHGNSWELVQCVDPVTCSSSSVMLDLPVHKSLAKAAKSMAGIPGRIQVRDRI
jgi:hypothetical protein